MLRYLLFDLDDTLYPPETGLWPAIGERISQYMIERVGVAPEGLVARRERYFREYGTTLGGLRREFKVDEQDYLRFVHDLPLEQFLQPNVKLKGMLARLPLIKVIFTNADAAHARRVLQRLDIERYFEHFIDINALDFINKPDPRAYQHALRLLSAQPGECLFVDDQSRNLRPARALGWVTVLVNTAPALDGADYQIADILGLERIVAGLVGQRW